MKYLILLIIFTGAAQAKILSCGQDEYANLNENCATCLPGYTKNPQGICVPEVLKAFPVVAPEKPAPDSAVLNYLPEFLGNWVKHVALATGVSAGVVVAGGAVGIVAVVAGGFVVMAKLRQPVKEIEKSVSRAASPSQPRAPSVTPKRSSGGAKLSAGQKEALQVSAATNKMHSAARKR